MDALVNGSQKENLGPTGTGGHTDELVLFNSIAQFVSSLPAHEQCLVVSPVATSANTRQAIANTQTRLATSIPMSRVHETKQLKRPELLRISTIKQQAQRDTYRCD